MKKIFIFVSCLILGPIIGFSSSVLWHQGANTFWKQLDYFPYPVKNLIATRQHGEEIWVETVDEELYQISYPCSENQPCWVKPDITPADLTEEPYIIYTVSEGKCENSNFVYPLFHKILICITSKEHAADATWTTSIALTDNNKLWVWDKDYEDPFSVIINMIFVTFVSTGVGFFIGSFFLAFEPTKKKRKT